MSKTLFLHIGLPKTGTTAIQRFCYYNRDLLAQQGYCYGKIMQSSTRVPSYVNGLFITEKIYSENKTIDKEATKAHFEEGLELVGKQLEAYNKVIVSAETIWNSLAYHAGWERIKQLDNFCKGRDTQIKIMVYLRAQDEYLESLWKQRIKNGYHVASWEEIKKNTPTSMKVDFVARLKRLEKYFGKENLIVRIYDRRSFEGADASIYSDFLAALGLEKTREYEEPEQLINTSIDIEFAEIKRILNHLQPVAEKNSALSEYLEKNAVLCTNIRRENSKEETTMFDVDDRKEFRQQYEAGNERIRKKFFPDKDCLFEEYPIEKKLFDKQNERMLDSVILYFGQMLWEQECQIEELKGRLVQIEKKTKETRLGKLKNKLRNRKR